MANVMCQNGWKTMLDAAVAAGKLARIRLFQNNHVPVNSDTVASYTEATFSGYPGYTALAFGAAFINGATQGEIDNAAVTWTHNGGGTANTIYGIYVTDGANNLMYAEMFGAPVTMTIATNFITYTPKFTMIDQ
jgi:hypothetical protein